MMAEDLEFCKANIERVDDAIREMNFNMNRIVAGFKQQLSGTPNLNAALALAQVEIKPPAKTKTAHVQMKAGGTYTFDYADLSDLESAIRGPLGRNGLSFVHLLSEPEPGRLLMTTQLRHASGEILETSMSFQRPEGGPQQFGSMLTYLKRYLLSALTSTSSEEDDDGNAAQGNDRKIEPKAKKPGPAIPPKAGEKAPEPKPDAKPIENPLKKEPERKPTDKITSKELGEITTVFKATSPKWTVDQLKNFSKQAFGHESAQDLTSAQGREMKNALTMTYEAALAAFATQPPEKEV